MESAVLDFVATVSCYPVVDVFMFAVKTQVYKKSKSPFKIILCVYQELTTTITTATVASTSIYGTDDRHNTTRVGILLFIFAIDFSRFHFISLSLFTMLRPRRVFGLLHRSTQSLLPHIACNNVSHLHLRHHSSIPDNANVIIVGGGIIGTSIAYHLSKLGLENIILLEQNQLTSGTTWHAAGLINTFGSLSSTSTEMRQYTKLLYSEILPKETGMSCGFMDVGFIELACDDDRLHYYRRVAAFNRFCGVDVREISPDEVLERFPICDTSDVQAGFYVPTDGRANPTDVTMALAKGARQRGVGIYEGVSVSGIVTENGHGPIPSAAGVTLSSGETIHANTVVNAAGMWARQLGEISGVNIPNQAAEHYYLLTEPMENVDPKWPIIEDSSKCTYIRPEGGGIMVGLFEWNGAPWNVKKIPNDFSFGEIGPDWDRMAPYLEEAMTRVPSLQNVGAKQFFCGPESFTPDGSPIVGQSAEIRSYYVAAGLNSIGILTAGGVGRILAQWIRDGNAPNDVDVTGISANRFHGYENNPSYRADRVGETLGNTYKLHFPDKQPKTCRGAKRSALHHRLMSRNACFRDVSGWESPAWYAPEGETPSFRKHSFGREHWFPHWAEEHRACRENVALFDMSFMSKFLVTGRDAGSFLNSLSTANVDGDCRKITYTQWLNEDGRMEADLTISKLTEESFLVVATDTMHNQVKTWMRRHLTNNMRVSLHDVTGTYSQINLQGPNSRSLLQLLTSEDLDDFPFRSMREIDIGYARVFCARITYVGELGYELFIPAEQACHVYDLIVEAGKGLNLKHAGLRALGSLRMEKGYRDYGHDMDNTDSLLEVGLGFTCDFEKQFGFIGREKVLEQKSTAKVEGGLTKRLAQVQVDDPRPLLYHGEVLWRDGARISDIRSGSYGHTIGGAVGLTMLESDEPINKGYIRNGEWSVEIADKFYPCKVSLQPLYDPKNHRIKV